MQQQQQWQQGEGASIQASGLMVCGVVIHTVCWRVVHAGRQGSGVAIEVRVILQGFFGHAGSVACSCARGL
jgi:hypothetical protein